MSSADASQSAEPVTARLGRARWELPALLLVLLVALGLRVYGLTWGWPASLHCDETSTVGWSLQFGQQLSDTGSLRPPRSDYGALPFYALLVFLAPLRALMTLVSGPVDTGALALLVGRGLSVLADLAALLLVWAFGRRSFGRVGGLLAAALYATALLAVREAHFYTVDPLSQFFVLLILWLSLRAAQRPSWRAFAWAGVAAGLYASIKMAALAWWPLPLVVWLVTAAQAPVEDRPATRRARVTLVVLALLTMVPALAWVMVGPRMADWGQHALQARLADLVSTGHAPVFWERQMTLVLTFLGGAFRKLALLGVLLGAAGLIWSATAGGAGALASAWRRKWWAVGYLLAAKLTFLVLNPFSLLEPAWYWLPSTNLGVAWNLLNAAGATRELPFAWTFQFVGTTPYLYQIEHVYPYALGWPLLVLALVAVVFWTVQLARRRAGAAWVVIAATLLALLALAGAWMKMARYFLPQVPLFCLLAGGMLGAMLQAPRRGWRVLGGALAAVTLAGSLLWCVAYLSMYGQPDSRLQALEWMRAHAPAGSHVLVEEDDTWGAAGLALWEQSSQWEVRIYNPHLIEHDYYGQELPPEQRAEKERYLAEHLAWADYLVLTGLRRERLRPVAQGFPVLTEFYRRLWGGQSNLTLAWECRPQPHLLGWTLSDAGAEPTFRLFDHPDVYLFARRAERGATP